MDNYILGLSQSNIRINQCKYKYIIESIPEIIFCKDLDKRYDIINKECEKFYNNMGVYDILGKKDTDLFFDKKTIEKRAKASDIVLKEKRSVTVEEVLQNPNTKEKRIYQTIKVPIIDENGNIQGLIGCSRDITKIKKLEERLKYLSFTDTHTGLYNKSYFDETIRKIKKRNKVSVGIVIGDVNDLKRINDTYGHGEGDNYLKVVAKILKNSSSKDDLVFRWGGDEFVIIISKGTKQDCIDYVNRVQKACEDSSYKVDKISIAQGYAVFNENCIMEESLKEADAMLYKNKIKMKSLKDDGEIKYHFVINSNKDI